MAALSSLLLPAIGGYWLLTHWNFTSFRAERDSGYHLLLRSAFCGVGLYVLAFYLLPHVICFANATVVRVAVFGFDFPPLDFSFVASLLDEPPVPLTGEALLSLSLGVMTPLILNLLFWRGFCVKRTAGQFGDHVELLLERALRERKLVEVGLRSRRAYVGFVMESGVGKTLDADAVLVPLYSGRRDQESLRLILDTDYPSMLTQLQRDNRPAPSDSSFVVPLSEIVSARLFDREVYNAIYETIELPERIEQQEEAEVPHVIVLSVASFLFAILAAIVFLLFTAIRLVLGIL